MQSAIGQTRNAATWRRSPGTWVQRLPAGSRRRIRRRCGGSWRRPRGTTPWPSPSITRSCRSLPPRTAGPRSAGDFAILSSGSGGRPAACGCRRRRSTWPPCALPLRKGLSTLDRRQLIRLRLQHVQAGRPRPRAQRAARHVRALRHRHQRGGSISWSTCASCAAMRLVNWTSIGIEHVGLSDAQVMGDARQLASSLAPDSVAALPLQHQGARRARTRRDVRLALAARAQARAAEERHAQRHGSRRDAALPGVAGRSALRLNVRLSLGVQANVNDLQRRRRERPRWFVRLRADRPHALPVGLDFHSWRMKIQPNRLTSRSRSPRLVRTWRHIATFSAHPLRRPSKTHERTPHAHESAQTPPSMPAVQTHEGDRRATARLHRPAH